MLNVLLKIKFIPQKTVEFITASCFRKIQLKTLKTFQRKVSYSKIHNKQNDIKWLSKPIHKIIE